MKRIRRFAALAALIAALVLCIAACAGNDAAQTAAEISEEGLDPYQGFRQTVLYFTTDDGFVVPVTKPIPWEEGIGRAALRCIVNTEENRDAAATMGLSLPVPEGTEFTLRIADDATATVDLIGLSACASADEERAMVEAIVNTLTEFPTIDAVKITVNGASDVTLPNGTKLSGAMSSCALNAEEGEITVSTDGASTLTLYFPNLSGSLNVPVTRYIEGAVTPETAVRELIAGPRAGALLNCFPEGTKLISAVIEDGVATVELSSEFLAVTSGTVGLDAAAYDTMFLTLDAIEDIARLDIIVDGEAYEFTTETSAPLYINEFR